MEFKEGYVEAFVKAALHLAAAGRAAKTASNLEKYKRWGKVLPDRTVARARKDLAEEAAKRSKQADFWIEEVEDGTGLPADHLVEKALEMADAFNADLPAASRGFAPYGVPLTDVILTWAESQLERIAEVVRNG